MGLSQIKTIVLAIFSFFVGSTISRNHSSGGSCKDVIGVNQFRLVILKLAPVKITIFTCHALAVLKTTVKIVLHTSFAKVPCCPSYMASSPLV